MIFLFDFTLLSIKGGTGALSPSLPFISEGVAHEVGTLSEAKIKKM